MTDYFEATLKFPIKDEKHKKLLFELAINGRAVCACGPVPLLYDAFSDSAQVFHYDDMSIKHRDGEFLIIANDPQKIRGLAKLIDVPVEISAAKKRFPQR